jgi:hypothetical protein
MSGEFLPRERSAPALTIHLVDSLVAPWIDSRKVE